MSIARAQLERARPLILQTARQTSLQAELSKGCLADCAPQPVVLEPPYDPVWTPNRVGGDCAEVRWRAQPVPEDGEIFRLRVCVFREDILDWTRCELLLKQLASRPRRLAFEILGNERQIVIQLACHREDAAEVSAAVSGWFPSCEVVPNDPDPMALLPRHAWRNGLFCDFFPAPPYTHRLTCPSELRVSPYEPLITALLRIPHPALGVYQCVFQSVDPEHNWHQNVEYLLDLEFGLKLMVSTPFGHRHTQQLPSGDLRHMAGELETKAHNDKPFFAAALRVAVLGAIETAPRLLAMLESVCRVFQHGGRPLQWLERSDYGFLSDRQVADLFRHLITYRTGFLVNSSELASIAHLPPAELLELRAAPAEILDSLAIPTGALTCGTPIGVSRRAGRERPISIPSDHRSLHTHLIGSSGTGKSSLMEPMILFDIHEREGVAVLDPHGDLIERLLCVLPASAIDRVIYFDPGDRDWVPIWNPLTPVPGQDLGRVADDLVGAFKSVVQGWGDRLEHLLKNTFFGLLHRPGSTLLDVYTLLSKKSEAGEQLRRGLLEVVDNPVSRQFFGEDLARYGKDDLGPPKNKLSKLLVSGTVSLMLSQPDSAFHLRAVMDEGHILLVNLSGLGTEAREMLGSLIMALLHLTALSRSDRPPDQRKPFHIHCDEAHRFLTTSLEDLIVETRKYGVSLTLAHHYLSQFGTRKVDALSGVGSTIMFRIDRKDAAHLAKDLRGLVRVDDLTNLKMREAIVRCGMDIVRIETLERPAKQPVDIRERILARSRQRYCRPAAEVRALLARGTPGSSVSHRSPDRPTDQVEELTFDEFD